MKRFPTDSKTDGGARMNAATPETAALGALDAADADALADDGFELLTEEETQEPGDPIEEEISAYLDGELTPEERGAFEEKIALQPELKARVEAERRAWDALDALDADSPNFELTEKTVDRLNSETQAELKALDAQETRRRNLYRTVGLAGAAAAFAIGFILFSSDPRPPRPARPIQLRPPAPRPKPRPPKNPIRSSKKTARSIAVRSGLRVWTSRRKNVCARSTVRLPSRRTRTGCGRPLKRTRAGLRSP